MNKPRWKIPVITAFLLIFLVFNCLISLDIIASPFMANKATKYGSSSSPTATYVIATSDAIAKEKSKADYILSGSNDSLNIQEVIDSMSEGESVRFLGRTVILGTAGIDLKDLDGCSFIAPNTIFEYSGTGIAIEWTPTSMCSRNMLDICVKATGSATSSESAQAFRLSSCQGGWFDLTVDDFWSGTGVEIVTKAESSYFEYNDMFLQLEARTGLKLTGDYSFVANYIRRFDLRLNSCEDNSIGVDVSENTYKAQGWEFPRINFWPHSTNTNHLIYGDGLVDTTIGHVFVDGLNGNGRATTLFYRCSDSLRVERLTMWAMDKSRIIRSPEQENSPWISEIEEDGDTIVGGNLRTAHGLSSGMFIPIVIDSGIDKSNNGGGTYTEGMGKTCYTSNDNNGVGAIRSNISFNTWDSTEWNTPFSYCFGLFRHGSDSKTIGRVQIKHIDEVGALIDQGLGIQIDDMAVKLETCGTHGSSVIVDPSFTMKDSQVYWIEIRFFPNNRVELWIDGVYQCEQATKTYIPSEGNKSARLYYSISKSSGGNTNCIMGVLNGYIASNF